MKKLSNNITLKLPNIITVIRIVFSLLLPFSTNHLQTFFILYILCSFSDALDGILARKLKAATKFGAFLDSIADFLFLIMSLIVVIVRGFHWSPYLLLAMGIIMILRIINITYTKYKFNQWGMIHTIGNKLMGFILFMMIPVAIIYGEIPLVCILLIGVLGIMSAIDESIILLKSKDYNVNQRCFLK